ncbi:hypothetical protein Syun_019045 [Stephania yunnanensis]|uniref:Uncharacterized protein n=1 Tax=Stephania yunnanensis TaxID=152371 RepID=A0AAP0IV09_9MAGN
MAEGCIPKESLKLETRRSTAWSRGNPRVYYAFVLDHRGEARPTAVSVCESWSCRRGDAKLSQEEPGARSGGRLGGREAVVVANNSGNVGAAAESDGTRGVGKGGYQDRKDRAGESRSTSTMTVDDDGDSGGEACTAAGNVHRRRRRKIRFAERGVEEDGFLIFTLFCIATDQRQIKSVADFLSLISDRLCFVTDLR